MTLPFWQRENLLVTDDGVTAVVIDADDTPHIRFFRDGALIRSWRLPGPGRRSHWSDTNWPGVTTPFLDWEQRDNFIVVTSRSNDQYTFIIQTGELVRRRYPSQLRPTPDELASFEAALARGEESDPESEQEPPAPDEGSVPDQTDDGWVQRIPAGAEAFVANDGAVRVVVISEAQSGGPRTIVYDGTGLELLSIREVFPRPVFLADVEAASVLGRTELPAGGRFPLVVSGNGEACALPVYSLNSRTTSIRVFASGGETVLDLPSTYSGILKSSDVQLTAVDDQRVVVELGYGTDWWERYEVHLGTATVNHSVNFPDDSDSEGSDTTRPRAYGWFGVLAPFAAIAFVILLLGFLMGRFTRRT